MHYLGLATEVVFGFVRLAGATSAVPEVGVWVQLQVNLFKLACLVARKIKTNADVLRFNVAKFFYRLCVLSFFASDCLSAQRENQIGKIVIFEDFRGQSLDQILSHSLYIVPIENSAVEAHTRAVKNLQENFDLLQLLLGEFY